MSELIEQNFSAEIAVKCDKGIFVIPAEWETERIKNRPQRSNNIVDVYKIYEDSFRHLRFDDPFAPYGTPMGNLICFKDQSPNHEKQLAVIEKKTKVAQKFSEVSYGDSPLFVELGGWLTVGLAFATSIVTFLAASAFGSTIGTTFAISFMAAFTVYLIAGMYFSLSDNSITKKALAKGREKHNKALAFEKKKLAKTDEMYFLGGKSVLWQVAVESNEAALMVREKLRTNPDPEELQQWAMTVSEIFELQGVLANGFPVDLIPLMAENARGVLDDLQERVTVLKVEWLEAQHDEALAVEYGKQASGNHDTLMVSARATQDGAKAFLAGLSHNDVTRSIDL